MKFSLIPRTPWERVSAIFTVCLAATLGYWAIIDRNPSTYGRGEILTHEVYPGGEFSIRYNVQWNSTCRITGYRFIIDSAGQQYTVAPDTRFISPSDAPEFTISIPIPLSAQPGPATYRATLFYECNPLQRMFPLERQVADRPFTILPSKSSSLISCSADRPVLVAAYCRKRPGG